MSVIRNIKTLLFGLGIGLLIGLWFGVNIGKDQRLFANPFANKSLQEKFLESSGDVLEKGGKALKDKVNTN
jgi:hypothetical protein